VVHRFPVTSLSEYQERFAEAGDALAVGEASTMYLKCPQSAARIRELLPAARIICGLSDPVERAYSDYQVYLRPRTRPRHQAAWARADSHWMRISKYTAAARLRVNHHFAELWRRWDARS